MRSDAGSCSSSASLLKRGLEVSLSMGWLRPGGGCDEGSRTTRLAAVSASSTPAPSQSPPLATLLAHTADAVQAVRAGRSLSDALARVPGAARPGAQSLAFHTLRWLGSAGPAKWEALLAANNRRPPMTLRVNARRGDAAGYLARLRAAGLDGEAFGTHTIVLAAPCPVSRLPGFGDGDVSVQDAGAQM